MRLLTADQLAEHLINSTKESFPRADTIEVIAVATVILFLKRIADQPGICEIRDPEPLRTIARSSQPNRELSELMKKVVDENHQIFGTITTAVPSLSWGFKPAQTKGFANSFADISLSDDKLQFPATVGVAYDRFLSHVMEAIGKRGAEISTPDSIAELMLRITSPEAGESVCDPFAGLGGFLALARGYVREASDDTADVDLFGQEIDLSVWFLAKLNLLLHGIRNAQLLAGDTLADP
jgi:type I restriction-modification system DNA methylase subunit